MKKRLLVLNIEFPPLGGGASPVSYELALQLSRSGLYAIDVVTMWYEGLATFEQVNDSFKIHRVYCGRKKKEMSYPGEQLRFLLAAFFKSRSLLLKQKFDLCHTHFIIPTGILSLVLKKLYRLEYVITAHGSDVLGYNQRFEKLYPLVSWFWKRVLDNARLVITPSRFLKEKILSVYPGYDQLKIDVVPNGVDLTLFPARQKTPSIVSSGRLLRNKGFQFLIQAVSNLETDWVVHIVGDGPMRDELEMMAKDSKTKVVFYGWLDNRSQTYRDLVGEASIFVSMSEVESFGMTVAEAMSAGAVVVVRGGSGAAELVGEAGVVIQGDPVTDLTAHLRDLLTNTEKRARMQLHAQERIAEYAWSKVTNMYARDL